MQAAARETLRLCRLSKAAQAGLEPQAPAPRGLRRPWGGPAPGRLKQWLGMLTRTYPEAMALFVALRRELEAAEARAAAGEETL